MVYLLTPWSRVLLEKLNGSAASQEIPRIFGPRRFITVLTSARPLSLSWANSIPSSQPPSTSWRSILILSSHLRLGLPRTMVYQCIFQNIYISYKHNNMDIMPSVLMIYPSVYTECPRRNVPDFGRVFLMLKYTDITQNTYVQIWTVTAIMAREVWNFDSCYTLIDYQIHIKTGRNMWFL